MINNKKGFTLIEVLAVILILGIVIGVAVPLFGNIITNSKYNLYNNLNDTVISSTKRYYAENIFELPLEEGDTVEITVGELKEKGYIKEIKSPFESNKDCNGYILITKVNDNEYSYNPHINCYEDIGSREEDGLILHYTFDDFQEPTKNLVGVIGGHGSKWEKIDDKYLGCDIYRNTITNPNTGNNFGFRGYSVLSLDQNGPKNITISFYSNIKISPGSLGGYVRVKYTDGTETNHSWSYRPNKWFNLINDSWNKVIGYVTLTQNKTPESITRWYVYKDYALEGEMDIACIQIEQKEYATPYVKSARSALVKDYSRNGNNSLLTMNTTPQWANGTYRFGYENAKIVTPFLMNNYNYGAPDAQYTLSIWLKMEKHNTTGTGVIFGAANYTGFGVHLSSSINEYSRISTYFRDQVAQYQTSHKALKLNEWYHIVSVLDRVEQNIKMYIDGELLDQKAVTTEQLRATNFPFGLNIINYPAGGGPWINMLGYMDEARVYNRTLNDKEILLLYNESKGNYK